MKTITEKPRAVRNSAYTYLIGRIRVLEKGLLSGKIVESALRAEDLDQVKRVLSEVPFLGESLQGIGNTLQSIDETLNSHYWETLREIGRSRAGKKLTAFFVLGFDTNALKLVLKRQIAQVRGGKEYPSSLSWTTLTRFMSGEGREYLPDFFRLAAEGALAIFENTGNVQMLEAEIDRRYLQEALNMAKVIESPVIKNWLIAYVLFAFIRAALRARFQERKNDFLQTLYFKNPFIKQEAFHELVTGTEEKVRETIDDFGFSDVFDREATLFDPVALAELERSMDNYLIRFIRAYRMAAFGPEPVFGYLYARCTDTRNLRILLEGKFFGIGEAELKRKLRESYYE
ncbi:MAG TPA: V-type ATPase subunit [Atribacteraceae bacterium]|nr:V-type ATPase subunit [Atribacteraceae bacterium]